MKVSGKNEAVINGLVVRRVITFCSIGVKEIVSMKQNGSRFSVIKVSCPDPS